MFDLNVLAQELKLTKEQIVLAQQLNFTEEQVRQLKKPSVKNLFKPKTLIKSKKEDIQNLLITTFTENLYSLETNERYLELFYNVLGLLFHYSPNNYINKLEENDVFQELTEEELQKHIISLIKENIKNVKLKERKKNKEEDIVEVIEKVEEKNLSPFDE